MPAWLEAAIFVTAIVLPMWIGSRIGKTKWAARGAGFSCLYILLAILQVVLAPLEPDGSKPMWSVVIATSVWPAIALFGAILLQRINDKSRPSS